MEQKDQVAKVDALLSRFLFKFYQLFRQTKSAVARRRYGGGCGTFRHHAKLGRTVADLLRGLKPHNPGPKRGKCGARIGGYSATLTMVALEKLLQFHAPEYDC